MAGTVLSEHVPVAGIYSYCTALISFAFSKQLRRVWS